MKKVLFIIAISVLLVSCKSSKGCGCPNPYGYVQPHLKNNTYLAYSKI